MSKINPKNTAMTQIKDGRWVPAQPIPYYRDSRKWHIRVWHSMLAMGMLFCWNQAHQDKYEDWLDGLMNKYLIPVEPYTDENGNWHHM